MWSVEQFLSSQPDRGLHLTPAFSLFPLFLCPLTSSPGWNLLHLPLDASELVIVQCRVSQDRGMRWSQKFYFIFFWQNQAWQDESLPLLVYSIFLYWIFIDSFVLSVTITDTLLFLLALSRGLQQQFDRSIEYRIKHANCPLNMVFILMPVNSKISKCFFRFLSLLQIFLKSMKFW